MAITERLKGKLIGFAATATVVGSTAFSVACNKEIQTPTIVHTPGIVRTLTPESPLTQWESLPANTRLVKLRENAYPQGEWFNKQVENTKAVIEFFCQQTKCDIAPNDIWDNHIEHVDKENIETRLQNRGFNLTSDEIKAKRYQSAFVVQDADGGNPVIFINDEAIVAEANDAIKRSPHLTDNNVDFLSYLRQSVLIHELGHLNTPNKELTLDNPFDYQGYKIDKIIGFSFFGKDKDGNQGNLSGQDEAMVELLALKIRVVSGFTLINPDYRDGVQLLDQLVKSAKISDQEFIEYTNGTRPISEFLEKIGNLKKENTFKNQAVGVKALIEIGLVTKRGINIQTGKDYLNSILKVNLK